MFAHIDADSFFASVLLRSNPRLRGRPLIAAGMGGGCVIAATYDAKAKGVRTGMRISEAKKLCPEATVEPSDFKGALTASREIERVLEDCSPSLEQMSVDEWFVDMRHCLGGLPADLEVWARNVQLSVQSKTALTVSIGVASSKTLAKMAGEYHKPAGVYVASNPQAFLQDRPAEAIPGVGRKRSVHTQANGWKTAWDFVEANPDIVRSIFGRTGHELQRELRGEEVYRLVDGCAPPQSISRCRSFRRTARFEPVWSQILDHISYVVHKMRREGLRCRRVFVWVRDGSYRGGRSVQCVFPQPIDTEEALLALLRTQIAPLATFSGGYTQVGVALADLSPAGALQPSLFDAPDQRLHEEHIQRAIDVLSRRHGRGTVRFGGSMLQ